MDAFLAALGRLFGVILDAVQRKPVAEPIAPPAPAWGDIDKREDAAASKRAAPGGAVK